MDFAVPVQHRVKLKESEKKDKYQNIDGELKKLWNIENKRKRKDTQNLGPFLIGRIRNQRKNRDWDWLESSEKTWGDLLSFRLQWKITPANVGMKNSPEVIKKIIIMFKSSGGIMTTKVQSLPSFILKLLWPHNSVVSCFYFPHYFLLLFFKRLFSLFFPRPTLKKREERGKSMLSLTSSSLSKPSHQHIEANKNTKESFHSYCDAHRQWEREVGWTSNHSFHEISFFFLFSSNDPLKKRLAWPAFRTNELVNTWVPGNSWRWLSEMQRLVDASKGKLSWPVK